jgi:hypothetical protein
MRGRMGHMPRIIKLLLVLYLILLIPTSLGVLIALIQRKYEAAALSAFFAAYLIWIGRHFIRYCICLSRRPLDEPTDPPPATH